jgi:hypothetical protein
VERDVRRKGHEVVGYARSSQEAKAAISSGVADLVAGRPEHLAALLPWGLSIPKPTHGVPPPLLVVPTALAAWWASRRTWLLPAAAAGLAGVAAFVLLPGPSPRVGRPPEAGDGAVLSAPSLGPPVQRPMGRTRPPLETVPSTSPAPTASPSATPAPTPTESTTPACLLHVRLKLPHLPIDVCLP